MNPNHPQNYSEIPPSILSRFRSHLGSDWGRILPPVWPTTNPFGPQRPSQWPQKAPRGPKGLPWGAPRDPKGSPRRPTIPFWLNFGRWFPGGSANFALNHPKNVADLRPCLPTISEISLCRHGDEAQHDWCQPSVSPATYDVVMPITIYNIESAYRWLQSRVGKLHTWFHEDGAEIQDAYTVPV